MPLQQKAILTLFSFHLLLNTVAEIQTTTKTIHLKEKTPFLVDLDSFSSPGMVFGACDSIEKNAHKRHCTLVLETSKPVTSPDHLRVCHINLESRSDRGMIGQVYRVIAFGQDKAILVWYDDRFLNRYGIVHFSNCRVVVAKIDDNINFANIMTTSEDTFEVVVHNFGKSICKSSKYCRFIVDDEGNLLTGLMEWRGDEVHDIIAVAESSEGNHLIVDADSSWSKIRIVNENDFSVLKEYSRSNKEILSAPVLAISKTHNLLSTCYQISKYEFDCSQFDLTGKLMFETKLKLKNPTRTAVVHNIPGGGFLLVTEVCQFHNMNKCSNIDDNQISVTKFDAAGTQIGSFVLELGHGGDKFDLKRIHFFYNKRDHYCLSSPHYIGGQNGQVDLSVVCFRNGEFSKF